MLGGIAQRSMLLLWLIEMCTESELLRGRDCLALSEVYLMPKSQGPKPKFSNLCPRSPKNTKTLNPTYYSAGAPCGHTIFTYMTELERLGQN